MIIIIISPHQNNEDLPCCLYSFFLQQRALLALSIHLYYKKYKTVTIMIMTIVFKHGADADDNRKRWINPSPLTSLKSNDDHLCADFAASQIWTPKLKLKTFPFDLDISLAFLYPNWIQKSWIQSTKSEKYLKFDQSQYNRDHLRAKLPAALRTIVFSINQAVQDWKLTLQENEKKKKQFCYLQNMCQIVPMTQSRII